MSTLNGNILIKIINGTVLIDKLIHSTMIRISLVKVRVYQNTVRDWSFDHYSNAQRYIGIFNNKKSLFDDK